MILGSRQPLLGGQRIQLHGALIVTLGALTVVVHHAQIELRQRMTDFGVLAEFGQSPLVVPGFIGLHTRFIVGGQGQGGCCAEQGDEA